MNAPYDRERGRPPGDDDRAAHSGQYHFLEETAPLPRTGTPQEPAPQSLRPESPYPGNPADAGQQTPGPSGQQPTPAAFSGAETGSGETPAGTSGSVGGRHDAFAHLFRDQQQPRPQPQPTAQQHGPSPSETAGLPQSPYGAAATPGAAAGPPPGTAPGTAPGGVPAPGSSPEPEPETAAAPKEPAGRAGGFLKSSAIMAAGTLVSRVTGFIRQLVIIAALGAAVLGDSYNVAMSLPTMIYILTIGGGLNSVFVPQLVRAMKQDEDGGEAYANRLLTLVMVLLGGLVVAAVLAAPLLVRMMSVKIAGDPASNEVAVTFARYCLPTIFFMGVHVVLGQILNARGYFGPMMWTPVLNNIVVIATFGMFVWIYGTQSSSQLGVTTITPEGLRLLGVGTLLGLTVQALAMVPYLHNSGFRIRLRFDWRGSGMGKAARLAKWTVLFVLANQVGLVVVSQLATWAGESAAERGYPGTGYIGYSSALLIWQMPQAIITVSVMAALLPRISRAAADHDTAAVRDDLSHGMRTSAVAIVPIAFAFVALGIPMCTLMFGASGETSARSIGYILMAFGIGLIPFSAQYVVLRAFYAYEDTRTPFYNTVIVSGVWAALSGVCFVLLPDRWVVAGIAFSYGVAYAIGVLVAWRRLRRRLRSDLDGPRIVRTYARLTGAGIPAAVLGGAAGYALTQMLGSGLAGSLAALTGGAVVLFAVFYAAARRMRIAELTTLVGMVRARLGR